MNRYRIVLMFSRFGRPDYSRAPKLSLGFLSLKIKHALRKSQEGVTKGTDTHSAWRDVSEGIPREVSANRVSSVLWTHYTA